MGRQFVGIDLGTTTFKGAVLDLEHHTFGHVERVAAPPGISGLRPGRHEIDAETTLQRVRELLECLGRQSADVSGLVMCGQMHGVVLTDSGGRAQSNIITWKDQRSLEVGQPGKESLIDGLLRQVSPSQLSDIGGELRPGVPICTLTALRHEKLLRNGQFATSLSDFVLANLCETVPTTEPTNAAAHGLYNLDTRDWHSDLITQLGLDGLHLPEIRSFHDSVGSVTIAGRKLTCFTPVGDQQCALVGAGVREQDLSLNISTGSQVSLISRSGTRGDYLVRPYFDSQWLRTIVSVPAGRALQILVDLLTEMGGTAVDPRDFIRNAVEGVDETDLEVNLSFFASLTGSHGHIANIHEGNLSIGHLFVAAFQSMAANYARCAAIISPSCEWNRVVFSGSLAQQFARLRKESLLQLGSPPSHVSESEEDTLRGLLILALVCDGQAKTVKEASRLLA